MTCDAGNPFNHSIQAIIKNNFVTNNIARGKLTFGGGIAYFDANGWGHLTIAGNTISGNEAVTVGEGGQALGGGIRLENIEGGSKISGNIIFNNSTLSGPTGSIGYGEGVHFNVYINPGIDDFLLIEKNRITGNTASQNGAGVNCQNTPVKVVNNFISGSMYINFVPGVLLMNNIFYGNEAPEYNELGISNSIVQINNCDINPRPLDRAIDVGACVVDMLYVGLDESSVVSRQSTVDRCRCRLTTGRLIKL